MGNFEIIIEPVLTNEGVTERNPTGYADIPGDTGGVTKFGISTKAYNGIRNDIRLKGFPDNVKDLTKDQAVYLYKTFWYKSWMDTLDPSCAFLLFDHEVNSGQSEVVLQRAVGVKDDGIVGPETLLAAKRASRDIPEFVNEILWQRVMWYRGISVNDTTNQRFLVKLWLPRLNACRKMVKTL